MPYKQGKLKGQLTNAEIRKLVRTHNKLSKIKIPPKSTRDDLLSIISKAGFRVNHDKEVLEQTSKKTITLEKAIEITKPKPRNNLKDKTLSISKDKKEMPPKINQQQLQNIKVIDTTKSLQKKVDNLEKEKQKFQDMMKEAKTLKEKLEIKKKAMPLVKEITRLKNIIVDRQLKEQNEKESKKPKSPPKKESLVFEVGKEYMTIEDKFKDDDFNDEKKEKKIKIIKRTKKFITFDYFENGKLLSENVRRSIRRTDETVPEFLPAPFSISAINVV